MNRPLTAGDISDASLPVITLSGELAKNATDGEQALLAAGVDIYENCGKLVRPVVESVTAARGRKTHVAHLAEDSPAGLLL